MVPDVFAFPRWHLARAQTSPGPAAPVLKNSLGWDGDERGHSSAPRLVVQTWAVGVADAGGVGSRQKTREGPRGSHVLGGNAAQRTASFPAKGS